MWWFLVAAAIIATAVTYNKIQRLLFNLPPGPTPWPIVGNLYHIKPVRFNCYYEWAQYYGPIISVWIGSKLNVVVCSAELAKQVLKDHDQQIADRYRSRSTEAFSRNGKDLIWADYGPHYVKVRKVCMVELFTPQRLESFRGIREDEVTTMVESIFRDCELPGKNNVLVKRENKIDENELRKFIFGVAKICLLKT